MAPLVRTAKIENAKPVAILGKRLNHIKCRLPSPQPAGFKAFLARIIIAVGKSLSVPPTVRPESKLTRR